MAIHQQIATSWGRIRRVSHAVMRPRFAEEVGAQFLDAKAAPYLPVGLRRSYGDTVLNAGGTLIDTGGLDRFVEFDDEQGILRAEAGLSIDAALRIIVPKGWFFNTTPGTRYVTLAGAVANDVHGKNHHRNGTFGCGVRRIGLMRSDATFEVLDAKDERFRATIGGLGLTGLIAWVEVQLVRIPSSRLSVERIAFGNLAEFFALAADSAASHEHTVAWIDCASGGRALGRGIFQRAEWDVGSDRTTHASRTKASMPFDAPAQALNGMTVRAFNALYWRNQQRGPQVRSEHYGTFFYPLDAIRNWNRLYGKRGFYQYQCVIPPDTASTAISELVAQIVRTGAGSFLAVLKTFGDVASPGMLSFPRPGATLALDFANRGSDTLSLLARLDSIVLEAGGRLYAAKDGRMPAAMFRAGYGAQLAAFERHRDPAFTSDFWKRVSA